MVTQSEMTDGQVRLFLLEDHHIMRRALRVYLQANPEIVIVGELSDGKQLIPAVEQQRPDVLLMDLEMPNHQPVQAVTTLRQQYPELKIVVLSAHSEPKYVVDLIKAGVHGYILKDDASGSVVKAIGKVMAGEQWISPQAAVVLANYVRLNGDSLDSRLTKREKEVLTLVAAGYRNEEIGDALVISVHTVRNHIASIFKKLEAETRIEAVVLALSSGLLSLNDVEDEFEDRLDR